MCNPEGTAPGSLAWRISLVVVVAAGCPAPSPAAPPSLAAQQPSAVRPSDTVTNGLGMRLRLIRAGGFLQGDVRLGPGDPRGYDRHFNRTHVGGAGASEIYRSDEQPRHPVRLTQPFYLATTEVTVAQFQKFVEATGYRTTAESRGEGMVGFQAKPPPNRPPRNHHPFARRPELTWRSPGFRQEADHPVVGVSWQDAQEFCRWLSDKEGVRYRLPTEAEWEYACRAGTTTFFSWGDDFQGVIHRRANIGNVELEKAFPQRVLRQWLVDVERDPPDPHVFTAPAGSYPANPWGLHDLHGNVWEWCEDHYSDTFYERCRAEQRHRPLNWAVDPINTKPWNEHGQWRVIRGGSWFTSPAYCRSAKRSYFDAPDAACYLGFRVARAAPAEEVRAARAAYEAEVAALRAVEKSAGTFHAGRNDGLQVRFPRGLPEPSVTSQLRRIPRLTEVVVNGDATPMFLTHLATIDDLRFLSLHQAAANAPASSFGALAGKTTLEVLHFTGPTTRGDSLLPHLKRLVGLRELVLEGTGFTDAGLGQLRGLNKLEVLNVYATACTGGSLSAFAGAPLRRLAIQHLGDAHAHHLRQFPTLRALDCRQAPLTAAGFAHAATLTRLETLHLHGCRGIADRGFAPLAQMGRLQRLYLSGSGAGDRAVGHLTKLSKLEELELGSAALSNEGLKQVGELLSLHSLTLSADASEVTDAGLAHLWRLNQLQRLVVESARVNGSGLAAVAELENLRELALTSRALSDSAFEDLAAMPALERLTIGSTAGGPRALTDAGLLRLADSPRLRELILFRSGTAVTGRGIAKLQQLRSNLSVRIR